AAYDRRTSPCAVGFAAGQHPRYLVAHDNAHFLDSNARPGRAVDSDSAKSLLADVAGDGLLRLARQVDRSPRRADAVATLVTGRHAAVSDPGRHCRCSRLCLLQVPWALRSLDAEYRPNRQMEVLLRGARNRLRARIRNSHFAIPPR